MSKGDKLFCGLLSRQDMAEQLTSFGHQNALCVKCDDANICVLCDE